MHFHAIVVGQLSRRCFSRCQQYPHGHAQLDIHHVIARTTSVRETGGITGQHTQRLLAGGRFGCDGRVQAHHFRRHRQACGLVQALDAGQERRDQVGTRKQVGRLHDRKQDFEQLRQRRLHDILGELGVILRPRGIELVLVRQADHHFIHQRCRQARKLLHAAQSIGLAGRCPRADDRAAARGQAADRHLDGERGHVLVGQFIGIGIRGADRVEIDQVEHFAQGHGKAFLALSDEDPGLARASPQSHPVDVVVGVGGVVGDGLVADIVQRLAEGRATRGQVGGGIGLAFAAQGDAVAFNQVLDAVVGTGRRANLADIDQRHGYLLAIDGNRKALEIVVDPEFEAQVSQCVAVIVDVDGIDRLRIKGKVVGTAVGILQRDIVRDQRDIAFASGLVAAEYIEISAVHFRGFGDQGRLAMAGGEGHGAAEQQAGNGEAD